MIFAAIFGAGAGEKKEIGLSGATRSAMCTHSVNKLVKCVCTSCISVICRYDR